LTQKGQLQNVNIENGNYILSDYWQSNATDILVAIKEQIKAALKKSDLKTFEKPQLVYVTSREMTVSNDCITPTMKVRRNFAKKYFVQEIKDMYERVANKVEILDMMA